MITLPQLHRRLSRGIERGKSMRLEKAELDLVIQTGAYQRICTGAAETQIARAGARIDQRTAKAAAELKAAEERWQAQRPLRERDNPGVATLERERLWRMRWKPSPEADQVDADFTAAGAADDIPVATLTTLQRRLSRASDEGRGIVMDAAEVDAFVACGAFAELSAAAAEAQKKEALARLDAPKPPRPPIRRGPFRRR